MVGKNVIYLSFSKRIFRAFINLVLFMSATLILYFCAFNIPFNTQKETNLKLDAFLNSGLYLQNENGYGLLDSNNYLDYENVIKKYYVGKSTDNDAIVESYFDTEFYVNNGGKRTRKSVEWYNVNILFINDENEFFEYKIINNQIDKNAFGVIKDTCYEIREGKKQLIKEKEELIYNFFKNQYLNCFQDLNNDEFYKETFQNQRMKNILRTFLSLLVSSAIFYLIIPMINKKTIGDYIFKGEIANCNGTYAQRYKILIRWIPQLALISCSFISENIFILLTISLLYLIISCISILLSKEHFSLPDYLSKTCLVDLKDTILFMTTADQKKYQEDLLSQANAITDEYYDKGDE